MTAMLLRLLAQSDTAAASLALNIFACLVLPVVIVVVIVAVANAEKAKAERFRKFAESIGFTYQSAVAFGQGNGMLEMLYASPQAKNAFLGKYVGMAPFGNSTENVKHIFNGTVEDIPFEAFQYQYTTGSGKNRTTHYFAAASMMFPIPVPSMRLTREDTFDKIGKFFGGQDVEFESNEFNERYRVRATREREVHAMLDPKMLEFLLASGMNNVETDLNRLVVFEQGVIDTPFVESAIVNLAEFWKRVPQIVKDGKI